MISDVSNGRKWQGITRRDNIRPMSNHPLNLALRFVLELAALAAMGYWGWVAHDGGSRYLWVIGLPLVAAAIWGTFRVPGDPGKAPVAVPKTARLLLEVVFFAGAVWCLYAAGRPVLSVAFAAAVLIHYALAYDRVLDFLGR